MNEEQRAYAVLRAAQERVYEAKRALDIARRALDSADAAYWNVVNGARK